MIYKLTVVCLAFVLYTAQCHENHNLTTRASVSGLEGTRLGIYCGKPTIVQRHPYLVDILLDSSHFCAGTIVSLTWIVTLGDCAYGYAPSRINIVAGSQVGYFGQWYQVEQIIVHPQYGSNTFDYDFACIKIVGAFQWSSKVQPIALARSDPALNSKLVVAGWGDLGSVGKGESNNVMIEGSMYWLSQSTCSSFYSDFGFEWTCRMGCTFNRACTTPCRGDWGDAFVQDGAFYAMYIAGATSGFCSSSALPAIVADISSVAPWISGLTGAKIQDV